jgi:hypothetical protein
VVVVSFCDVDFLLYLDALGVGAAPLGEELKVA